VFQACSWLKVLSRRLVSVCLSVSVFVSDKGRTNKVKEKKIRSSSSSNNNDK
jgi:hypothetical protein